MEFEVVVEQVGQVLAHRVGRALIPGGVGEGLFRREDFHEAAGEMIKLVGLRNVPVQRGRVELRQQIDALEVGVDAVRDGDVHQAVLAGERHRRLGAILGEGEQARALSAAHDDGKDVAGVGRKSFAEHKTNPFLPAAMLDLYPAGLEQRKRQPMERERSGVMGCWSMGRTDVAPTHYSITPTLHPPV